MAETTMNIHVRVMAFHPPSGRNLPVPGATVKCVDFGWLSDTDLSPASSPSEGDGHAQITVTFDDTKERSLNPYFVIDVPEAARSFPGSETPERRIDLPARWETRHHENHRVAKISDLADPAKALEIFVGLGARLGIGWSDFEPDGLHNPIALPEDTTRVMLADYDDFLWIDFLNPDDTITGSGYNPRANAVVPAGEKYPYFDVWPTEPSAYLAEPGPPRACFDPPGAPVGILGGGSFDDAGPMAVDSDGFVFLVDGDVIRRFYPDGALAETIPEPGSGVVLRGPKGLALDQYRNLYVADTGSDRVVVFRPQFAAGERGRYLNVLTPFGFSAPGFSRPEGVAIVHDRAVDADEFLAVVDTGNRVVKLFRISIIAFGALDPSLTPSIRAASTRTITLALLSTFGSSGAAPGQFQDPAGIASQLNGRLFVTDRVLHRVSVWRPDAVGTNYMHDSDWEKTGGGSGSGIREFNTPESIAVDRKEELVYVVDRGNNRIQRIDAASGNLLLDWAPNPGGAFAPSHIAIDARGEIYVSDSASKRVLRASSFNANGSAIGSLSAPRDIGETWTASAGEAHMKSPGYVHFAPDGKLWVADTGNNRIKVFERNASGELAPSAAPPAAGFDRPAGIAVAADGHVFVVDSGNNRVRHFDQALAHVADLGGPGPGANQFLEPRGIATAEGDAPLIYVADRDNNRVQVLKRDGSFEKSLTTDGATALKAPEDVAVGAGGHIYVADTGNARIVKFQSNGDPDGAIAITGVAMGFRAPCGVSVDGRGNLIVSDRGRNAVYRLDAAGKVLAFWNLGNRLRKSVDPLLFFEPELRRMIVFNAPARAAIDQSGLLAVADTDNHRVRLIRTRTGIDVHTNLSDLGPEVPDISFRAISEADWKAEFGLKVEAGGSDHNFITDPADAFSLDEYREEHVLREAKYSSQATNALRVARQAHTWLFRLTRIGEAEFQWGHPSHFNRELSLNLEQTPGSEHAFDDDEVRLGTDTTGKGGDGWDDTVIVHEMTHWVFDQATRPRVPFKRIGRTHNHRLITSHSTAILEGFAEYFELFWGTEYGPSSRIRGFDFQGSSQLLEIQTVDDKEKVTGRSYLYGGATSAAPHFNDPEGGALVEGYFANCCYQIHHALVDPEIRFADSSGYWYPYNSALTDSQSRSFTRILWDALRDFPDDPTDEQFNSGSKQYLRQVLDQAHSFNSRLGLIAQAVMELNNQLMPKIELTEGASTSAPGTAVGTSINVALGSARSFIVRITGPTGRPLAGYSLLISVAGAGGTVALAPVGTEPDVVAGFNFSGTERGSNVDGIVNFSYTAPAAAGTDTLTVSYQPNFDGDDAFGLPSKGDDRETTLRKLYLYELRAANKIWAGVGNNRGAIVQRTLTLHAG